MRILRGGAFVAVALFAGLGALPLAGAAMPPTELAPAPSFVLTSASAHYVLSPSFWGVNVRPYAALTAGVATGVAATPLQVVRWPGGEVADQLNLSRNVIYHDDGSTYSPPGSFPAFAAWCSSLRCRAIIGLPGEIDSPSTAAYDVRYIEQVVGFHPAYYEIGNEPALWTHFGVPWSAWSTSQHLTATPASYAQVVRAYVEAIRSVDPAAQIIGLPGVGTGASAETAWIQATVAVNGPNLSAVAIHVYPAGPGPSGTPELGAFYGSLSGAGSLAQRLPADRAAILSACPSCHGLQLFVTELGEGTGGGSYDGFMAGAPGVTYLAAELAQGIEANLSNLDVFALQSTYPASLFASNGAATPTGSLYETALRALGPHVLGLSSSPASPAAGRRSWS
jgi:hypothetical protein